MKNLLLKLRLAFIPGEENNFRPRFLEGRFLAYYLILLLFLKLLILPFSVYFPKTLLFADITKTALVDYANQIRGSLGLLSLKESSDLNRAAYLKAKDILEKDYFDHWSPEGVSPWRWFDEAGYDYKFAGENLAIGFLDSDEVHQAWLDSPTHKQNILSKNYQEIGIAVLAGEFDGRETNVVVQLFGSQPAKPAGRLVSAGESQISEKAPKEEIPVPANSVPTPLETKREVLSAFQGAEEGGSKDFYTKALSFLWLDYYDFLQKIIYGSLILVILALSLNVFVRFDIQYKDLILKAFGFIVLLGIFVFLDKGQILSYLPHQLRIN